MFRRARVLCTSEQRTATARQGYASDVSRSAAGLHRSDMGSIATAKRGGANQGMATRRLRRELQRRCFGLLGAAWQRGGTAMKRKARQGHGIGQKCLAAEKRTKAWKINATARLCSELYCGVSQRPCTVTEAPRSKGEVVPCIAQRGKGRVRLWDAWYALRRKGKAGLRAAKQRQST